MLTIDSNGNEDEAARARNISAFKMAVAQAGLRSTSTSVCVWTFDNTRLDKTTAINLCGVRYLRRDLLPNEFFMWLKVSSHA